MTPERVEQFGDVYTGAVSDILDELGQARFTLPSSLKPLRAGMRLAGPVFPVRGRPMPQRPYDASIRRILTMLGEVPEGSIAVYETHDSESAHLGELSLTALSVRGCRGVVVDGGVRDVRYLLDTGLPVFSRYVTPVDSVPRWELLDWGDAVTIGDVEIRAGDILVADEDGIVRVPASLADEVLERSRELVSTENGVRAAVRSGVPPLEAYGRFGKF